MVKLLVMYNQPEDVEAFRAHYFGTHMPIAEKIANVRRFEVTTLSTLDGAAPPFCMVSEFWFDSREDLMAGLTSEAGQAAAADLANFAQAGVTLAVAEVEMKG